MCNILAYFKSCSNRFHQTLLGLCSTLKLKQGNETKVVQTIEILEQSYSRSQDSCSRFYAWHIHVRTHFRLILKFKSLEISHKIQNAFGLWTTPTYTELILAICYFVSNQGRNNLLLHRFLSFKWNKFRSLCTAILTLITFETTILDLTKLNTILQHIRGTEDLSIYGKISRKVCRSLKNIKTNFRDPKILRKCQFSSPKISKIFF